MKKVFYLSIAVVLASYGCENKTTETTENTTVIVTEPAEDTTETQQPAQPQQVWASDTSLQTPESVLYDKENNLYYVSNVAGQDPSKKDNNGFISTLDSSGKVTNLKWATGLHAPKGMAQLAGKLYVTDIDKLVEIDKKSGKITKTYPVKGGKFLNDITEDSNGNVLYVTDMEDNKIYKFENGKLAVWLDKGLNGPNGLLFQDNKLYMASMPDSTLNVIDPTSKEIKKIASGIPAADGIESTGKANEFLVSNWNGEVYLVKDSTATKILDTKDQKVNAADIEYVQEKQLLLVPTFFDNRVVSYKIAQ